MPMPPESRRCPHYAHMEVLGHIFRVAHWRADKGPTSPPLLFFTGIGANIELLAPFLERFSDRDVLTFDMPGVGGTPDYPHPYRLSTMAAAAGKILDRLGYQHVDVMGVSWGGMLAQEYAFRNPQRVGRLVLAATTAGFPLIPGSLSTIVKMLSPHRYTDVLSIAHFLQALYGGSGKGLDAYATRMRAPSSTGYLHQILAIAGWTSVRKLTRVRAKTLILMGKEDRLVPPANGHILKFLLEDAELEIFEDAGHLFVLTHADAVSRRIEHFLGSRGELRSDPLGGSLEPLAV